LSIKISFDGSAPNGHLPGMGDGAGWTSLLTFDVSGTARWFAGSADIFDVLVMFLPYRYHKVVIVIGYHFEYISGTGFYALATTVALIAIDNDVPIS